jgi:hypothetical protein
MNRTALGWSYAAPDLSFIEYQVIASKVEKIYTENYFHIGRDSQSQ